LNFFQLLKYNKLFFNGSAVRLSEILNESAGISAEMASRLERAFGVKAQLDLTCNQGMTCGRQKDSRKFTRIRHITSK